MTVPVWLFISILGLKLLWNLGVPFELLRRARARPDQPRSGISLATYFEVILLLIAIGLSALSSGDSWVNRPLLVAGWGVAAIVLSYVLLVIVGFVVGWFAYRKSPPTSTKFNSIKDLFMATRQLRDLLLEQGEVQAAQELEDTVTKFWTTGGEAIGELKTSLLKVRPIVEHKLAPEALTLWNEIFDGATRLWDLSNHT